MRRARALTIAAVAWTVAACAHADEQWITTGDEVLAQMRGGFALSSGLVVSFGIVRTVTVDGQLVSRTALNIPDVGSLTPDQARMLGQQAANLSIVQSGPGNTVQLAPSSALLPGLVIQNSASNRQLQAVTEITVSANVLRALQGMNLDRSLSDALKLGLGR